MPYPFLPLAAALASGILIGAGVRLPAGVWLAGFAAGLGAAWGFFAPDRRRASFAAALVATAAAGAFLFTVEDRAFETNPLHLFRSEDYADFEGTLVRSPVREPASDVLRVRVDRVHAFGRDMPLRGDLQVSVNRSSLAPQRLRRLRGDRVRVSARLFTGRGFHNFDPPFYERFLKGKGIHARGFAKSPMLVATAAAGPSGSPLRLLSRLRQAFQARLEAAFPGEEPAGLSPEGAVLEALLLGDDGRMAETQNLALRRTGLYHLFAISGAHVAIITVLLMGLFKAARLPRRPAAAVLIGILVLYALLVEGNASVTRAVIMAVAFLSGRLLWKDAHPLNTISLSAFVLLAAHPVGLFDLGFQLTFAATLSIILFYAPVLRALPRLPLRISELTAVSITAMAGVMPLLVRHFNRVTLASLLLGYAAVPLVGAIMAAGYVFLPLSLIASGPAGLLARLLEALVRVFDRVLHLLDPVPFLSFRVPTPRAGVMIGYAACLLLLAAPRRFRGQREATAAAFGLFLALLIVPPRAPASPDLKVTFIDVGQGESILVEFPGRTRWLIDGGGFPVGGFDVGESVVSPFLWRKGIRRLDAVVLTHAHPDHLKGLEAVARNFAVGEFWETEAAPGNPDYASLQSALGARVGRRHAGEGHAVQVGQVTVEVLHPAGRLAGPFPEGAATAPPWSETEANDRSLVLRLTYGDFTMLLPADIGVGPEGELVEADRIGACLLLKAPHHGSKTSSSEAFLKAASPQWIVVCAGEGNMYGLPHPDIVARYERLGAAVFRTDRHGAVEVRTDGRAARIRTASGESAVWPPPTEAPLHVRER